MSKKPKAKLAMLLASDPLGNIGYKNSIPWRLEGDLPRFRKYTTGNVVIMGRSTHESLPGPLRDRIVIVLTRDPAFASEVHDPEANVYSATSMTDAITLAQTFGTEWIFLAGGAKVYEEGMGLVDTVFLTLVHKGPNQKYDTTVKNLNFDKDIWTRIGEQHVFEPDSLDGWYNRPSHTYYTFERIEK